MTENIVAQPDKQEQATAITILGSHFQLFPNGLTVHGKPTPQDYDKAFSQLAFIESATSWWWGDLANARERDYGSLKDIAERLGINYNALHVYQYVANRYELVMRITSLSFYHHQIAAPLEDRLEWLKEAKEKGWSAQQLKMAILKRQIEKPSFDGMPPLISKADYSVWLPKQPNCDLLLTDPPYSTEIDDIDNFAQSWLPKALSKVKPTGRAYIFIGAYPKEVKAYLNALGNQIENTQLLVWEYKNTMGPSPTFDYKLNWQAIIHYKGQKANPLQSPLLLEQYSVQNFAMPNTGQNPYHNRFEKPTELAEMLIRHSTQKGDLVLDCFAGIGTFLIAAAKYGRRAIGCDIDQLAVDNAIELGCVTDV